MKGIQLHDEKIGLCAIVLVCILAIENKDNDGDGVVASGVCMKTSYVNCAIPKKKNLINGSQCYAVPAIQCEIAQCEECEQQSIRM